MPKRLSKTEKILRLIEGMILETGSIMYPYKGVGRSWIKYRGEFSRALYDFTQTGYLETVEKGARKEYKLTKRGWLKIWRPKINKQWDGGWRIVLFDISDNKTRDVFREKLKYLGFKKLQHSVWVCPYDVTKYIEELLDLLDLHDKVDYLVTRAVTGDHNLRKMFNL